MSFQSDDSSEDGNGWASKKNRRGPDPLKLTDDALREAALRYLDRQDGSVEQLRRCLRRRVFRYGDEESRDEVHLRIEEVLTRLQASRLLDDMRFALTMAESQRRRGASLPKLRQKLMTRGIGREHIETAIESLSGDEELSDESCAGIYARKRRLRERFNLEDPVERNKALAALARQGFSFDVARKVLEL